MQCIHLLQFLMPEVVCCYLQTRKCAFDIRVAVYQVSWSGTLTQASYRYKHKPCCLQFMYVDCYGQHSPYTKFHSSPSPLACNPHTYLPIIMYCLGQCFVNYMYIIKKVTCHCTTRHGTQLVCEVWALYLLLKLNYLIRPLCKFLF